MNTIYKLLAFFPLLFLVAGCANEDELNPSSNDAGIYSLQVQMPGSDNPTRVDLTQIEGTKDLKATWQANDEVLLLLTQGDKEFNAGTVKVGDISEDGKQATINFILPNGINLTKPFTIYGFTGIEATVQYYEDNNWHPRCLASLQRSPIEKFKAPMFTKVEASYGQIPITSFHHFGTYELLHVKNSSNNYVSFAHNGFNVDKAWYQAAAFVEPDDGNGPVSPSGKWDGEDFSDSQTIAAGAEGVFISWYIPSGFPIAEAHLQVSVNGKEISSTNTFSSEVSLQRGNAYHMYATWNGESLSFDKGSSPNNSVAEAIDLGLPSGTKWASWNVGATKPEEYGDFYAWGETEVKEVYNWSTYIHCDGSSRTMHDIGEDIAGSKYDAAHVKWGGSWRMPSYEQFKELMNNCNWKWTKQNGVNGIQLTGINGNTIFLPASGRMVGSSHGDYGAMGDYRTSTRYPDRLSLMYNLVFYSDEWTWTANSPHYGTPIRPVISDKLIISQNSVKMKVGQNVTVEITSGSEDYSVSVDKPSVATASLSGSMITIQGVGVGSAVVTVKDNTFDQTVDIGVTVLVASTACPDNNHPHMIDMGLPSGIKWACCNVGASSSEEPGGYYAWGETEEKDAYTKNTYTHYDSDSRSYVFIGNEIAGTEYDVAHVKWGGSWRMPSYEQFKELMDNCSKEWKTQNGNRGVLLTGPYGATIFLPAAGYANGGYVYKKGSEGEYWTSSIDPENDYPIYLALYSKFDFYVIPDRYYGHSVRPISQ